MLPRAHRDGAASGGPVGFGGGFVAGAAERAGELLADAAGENHMSGIRSRITKSAIPPPMATAKKLVANATRSGADERGPAGAARTTGPVTVRAEASAVTGAAA